MSSSAFSVAFFIATIRLDLLARLGLEDGLEQAGRDVARQELLEDRRGVRLEDELVAGDPSVSSVGSIGSSWSISGRWVSVETKRL